MRRYLIAAVLTVLLVISFVQSNAFMEPTFTPKYFLLVLIGVLIVIGCCIRLVAMPESNLIAVNAIDISIGVYVVYVSINLLFTRGNLLMEQKWILLILLVVLYYISQHFMRNSNVKIDQNLINWVIAILVISAFFQSMWGLGQYFNFFTNTVSGFPIVGSFSNPGSYANFLVALLPFCLVATMKPSTRLFRYFSIVCIVLVLIALSLTMARTSWVSALTVSAYVLLHSKGIHQFWNKYFNSVVRRLGLVFTLVLLLLASVYALTSFKQDSVLGRYFIWIVTSQMIKDKPLLGHGFASYPVVHNTYQANYFRQNPDDWDKGLLADSVDYAFNEYLQFASELGLIGLMLFLLIPFVVFRAKKYKSITNESSWHVAAEGAVVAMLMSSIFSYPLQDISILILLFVCLTLLSAKETKAIRTFSLPSYVKRIVAFLFIIPTAMYGWLEYTRLNAEIEWKKNAYTMVKQGRVLAAKKSYEAIRKPLNYNPKFLFNYAAELSMMGEYKESIKILEELESRYNKPDFYNFLGNNYEGLGDYVKAFENFNQSSQIAPIKYYPKYRMVLLYKKLNDYVSAKELAQDILKMPVKIESEAVTAIRQEMAFFLEENK